jgi:hypothetical protein
VVTCAVTNNIDRKHLKLACYEKAGTGIDTTESNFHFSIHTIGSEFAPLYAVVLSVLRFARD